MLYSFEACRTETGVEDIERKFPTGRPCMAKAAINVDGAETGSKYTTELSWLGHKVQIEWIRSILMECTNCEGHDFTCCPQFEDKKRLEHLVLTWP